MRTWPEPVERVNAYLRQAGAEARIEEFPEETPTARAAADAIGCELRCVVKSLVFACDDRPVLAMVPGDRRADGAKVAAAVGAGTARVVPAAQVAAVTGFEPGAVAPFPLPAIDRVLIDRTLLVHERVWVGAGSTCHLAGLAPTELVRLTRAVPLDISSDVRSPAPMQETERIWFNGELVDWADAHVHVGAHGLHYGTGVFEGIRCYATEKGPAVFRLREHLERLDTSAKLIYMTLPYSVDELRRATHELLAANALDECYIRPIAFYGYGELGVHTGSNPVDVVIMSWPWGAYLSEDGQASGIRAMISTWKRVGPNTIPHAAKATGVYLNSMLATHEARRHGYDEAIMLTDDGTIADGPGETVFVVKDGVLSTPPLSTSILPGITRDTIVQLAQDLGYTVVERALIRTDLYVADEVFMTGTAAEVTPLRSVDDHEIGAGPITLELQRTYWDVVRGKIERYGDWLDHVATARAEA